MAKKKGRPGRVKRFSETILHAPWVLLQPITKLMSESLANIPVIEGTVAPGAPAGRNARIPLPAAMGQTAV